MQIAIIAFLVGMLGAGIVCLILIWKIETVYARIFGSDASIAAWQRKRWAFVLLTGAQALGVVSLFFEPQRWIALAYVMMMFLSLLGFCDSYRILLNDLKRLPRK